MTDFITISMCKELLDTQAKAYKDLVQILMENIRTDVKDLRNQVSELKVAAEFNGAKMDEFSVNLKSMETKQANLSKIIDDHSRSIDQNVNKLNYLENYGRRNNIKLLGVEDSENSKETWDDSENLFKAKVKELLNIKDELNIERAHRVGKFQKAYTDEAGRRIPEKPRAIVARFSSWKQKELVTKAARDVRPSGYMFADDFSDLTLARRKAQLPELKKARDEGKTAYFAVDRLIIKNRAPRNRQQSESEETEISFDRS